MAIELNEDISNQINAVRGVAQEIILEPEETREQKYQELKPALQQNLPGAPEQYDPEYLEALGVAVNSPADLQAVAQEFEDQSSMSVDSLLARDDREEVLKPFLNEQGIPEFNNDNIADFFRAIGRSESDINDLLKSSDNKVNLSFEEINALTELQGKLAGLRSEQIKQAKQVGAIGNENQLEKGAVKKLQEQNIETTKSMAELQTINENDEEINDLLSAVGRVKTSTSKLADLFNVDLLGSQERVERAQKMNTTLINNFAQYVKSISGGQVSDSERATLQEGYPNLSMTPTQFKTALNITMRNMTIANRVRQEFIEQGLNVDDSRFKQIVFDEIRKADDKDTTSASTDGMSRDDTRAKIRQRAAARGQNLTDEQVESLADQLLNKG
jgi:hypothetical protein